MSEPRNQARSQPSSPSVSPTPGPTPAGGRAGGGGTAAPAAGGAAAGGAGAGGAAAGGGRGSGPARLSALLSESELDTARRRWQDVQNEFVDDPRQAVHDADALVHELAEQIAQGFVAERQRLLTQWSRGEQVSTEDLRISLQLYRAFFQRLLAI